MAERKRVRVGIVGVGNIAQRNHLPGYGRCADDVEITMLCDVNQELLARVGHEHGVSQLTTDYHELVASDQVDAVDVCTWHHWHHPVTMAALAQGKHVFCEKPLGINFDEARQMYEAAQAAGVVAGVDFCHRATPASRLAQRIISSGDLGDIYNVIAIYSSGGTRFAEQPITHQRAQETWAGGPLIGLGPHLVDMVLWWLGEEITAVCARNPTLVKQRRLRGTDELVDVTMDDTACFLAEFSGGGIGTFICSHVFTARGHDQRIEVYGSKGALLYDQARPYELLGCVGHTMTDLYSVRVRKELPYPVIPTPRDLRNKWSDVPPSGTLVPEFVAAVQGREAFLPTFCDGMKTEEVLDAALISNADRGWVTLPLSSGWNG